MMKDPNHPDDGVREHHENSGNKQQPSRPSGPDRQDQYQRTREQVASGQEEQDREARIRRRAHEMWEAEGRPEGQADRHWSRAAEDLDREDAAIQREGTAGEKRGVRLTGDADFARDKS
jgi:Protein of unknown function (DUF2934)